MPDLGPLVSRPRSRRRVAPSRALVLLASGFLLAAAIALFVVVGTQPFVPQPVYTGMPKPCTMVPEPRQVIADAAEPPGGIVQVTGQHQTGTCDWITVTASDRPESLQLEVDVYGSSAGVAAAQKAYNSLVDKVSSNEAPNGIAQITWTAPGLGNQAIGQTWNGAPTAGESTVSVWVQSGNADIYLSYASGWNQSASDYSEQTPVMAMARDVLAALRKGSQS
jgi:hypothetical protein